MTLYKVYRVRRGFGGVCVLQGLFEGPAFEGGHVDASKRVEYWSDIPFDRAPTALFISPLREKTNDKLI
jgi:hypothetical protein